MDVIDISILTPSFCGIEIEISVLTEHETVDGNFTLVDPLTVVLDLRPTVIGHDRMVVHVENHAGRNLGTANSPAPTNST